MSTRVKTEEIVKRCSELYLMGTSLSDIAKEFGVTRQAVSLWLRSTNYSARIKKVACRQIPNDIRRAVVQLMSDGYTSSQISRKLGISRASVSRINKEDRDNPCCA